MANTVKITRYIRPFNRSGREIDSQKGVTLKIVLDYDKRLIGVQYSICNHKDGEPSFSKAEGMQIADERIQIQLPMWPGPGKLLETDLTEYVVGGLNSMAPFGISTSDVSRINKMFINSPARGIAS